MTNIPAVPAGAPAFVEPPAADPPKNDDGSTPVGVAPAGGENEELTPEQGAAEIERLRAELADAAKWKPIARKHERELAKLKGTVAPAADGAPPASTGPTEAELNALRFEVALDRGLSKAVAMRLLGTTREEMEADADELLELPGFKPAPPPPRFGGSADGGAGGGSGQQKPMTFGDQVAAALGLQRH